MNILDVFDLKVGFTCNNNCVHCVVSDKKLRKDLTTQEIKDVICSLDKPYMVGFTGGEATIREDFLELLKYAKSLGHQTSLQTNGTSFADEEFTKSVKPYLDNVLIAIHSCNTEIHDSIVQSKGMGEKTLKGFDNLIKHCIPCATQTVITKLNFSTLEETYDYIQNKAPKIFMNVTYPHQMGNAGINKHLMIQYSDLVETLYKILEKHASYIRTEAIPLCYLYPYHNKIHQNSDDTVLYNNVIRSGIDPSQQKKSEFFDEKGITDKYNEMNLLDKKKGLRCKECSYSFKCIGVWKEYIELFKGTLDLFPIYVESEKCGSLIINGNTKCMNTCVFCDGVSEDIDDKTKFEKIINEAQHFIDNGYQYLDISGGDPGEYNKLLEVFSFLKNSPIDMVQLSTHGRTLKDNNLVKIISYFKMIIVRVPLYGSTPEIHDKVVGSKGAFFDTLQGLRNIAMYGIAINAQIAINKYNEDDIENIIDLFFSIPNIKIRQLIIMPTSLSVMSSEYAKDWYLPIKDMKDVSKRINRKFYYMSEKEYCNNTILTLMSIPYCLVGKHSPFIDNMSGPPSMGIKELNPNFKCRVQGVPKYRIKTHFNECKKCFKFNECNGIPENDFEMFGVEGLEAIQ